MEPEDVLDFGEDDDGLDVISLGGSDHDGRPVSNRSSSTALESATRSIRQPRPSPPTQSRNPRSTPHTQPNGSDRLRPESAHRTTNHSEAAHRERNHQSSSRSTDRPAPRPDRRSHVEDASRDAERPSSTAPPRNRPSSDRPRPGERASYMPADRLQAISASSRTSGVPSTKPDSGRPIASLSTRITDQRDANQTPSKPLSPSKPAAEREKVEEVKNVEKAVEPSDEIASTPLPEGWISRISKGSKKTYYVNVFTRTSQWILPTEPASGKPTKPISKVAPHAEEKQPAQETSEIRTQPSRGDRLKNDNVAPATDSTTVRRPQAEGAEIQARTHSKSLDNHSLNLKPSSTIVSQDDRHHVAPQEPLRHHETSKPAKDDHHSTSNNMDPENAHASDSDIDGQSIQQEKTQPDISEPHSRDHRIHPDRRQEIASSMHPDRRQEMSRARESAPEHCKSKPVASFHRDPPPHSDSTNRDSPRQGAPTRYPHDSDRFRSAINSRPRSISPAPRRAPSHRIGKRDLREPVQLSGSNGIPTGPGRSFPEPITPSQPHEMFINTEVSRYSRPLSISSKTAEPSDPRDMDRRRGPDHTYDRDITNQDRRPSSWSRQEGGIISPLHPPQRHPPTLRPSSPSPHRRPSVLRPRSPSPPPRRMQTSIQGASRAHMQSDLYPDQRSRSPPPSSRVIFEDRTPGISQQFLTQSGTRAHLQPDLYPAERSRPSPASSRALPEDPPIQAPEQSDLIRRNPASRYDAYRPSPSFPSEINGVRHHDVRRGDAYYPRDQGPQRSEPRQLDIRRSQVSQHVPNLPEQPKVPKGMSQPDFYRPSSRPLNAPRLSPRPVHAPGVSPRHTQPIKYYPIIDLDEIPHKHDTPSAPSTLRNTHVPPSPACPIKEAPQSSHRQESDRSQELKHSKHTSDKQVNLPTKDRREIPSNDSQKPLTEGGAKPPPNEARKPPPPDVKKTSQKDGNKVVESNLKEPSNKTLAIPKQQDRTGARGRSIEADEISEKGAMASSDIIEILPPQSVQVPHEPLKQSISLAKRLGPVADCSIGHDELSPPAKRSRRNPVDPIHASDLSNDLTRTPKVLLPEKMSPPTRRMSSSPPYSAEKIQSELVIVEPPPKLEKMFDDNSSSQAHQEKVISLRGRAGLKRDHHEVTEPQQGPQVKERRKSAVIPIGNGSLRDRIQDLQFSAAPAARSLPSSQQASPGGAPQRLQVDDQQHDAPHGESRADQRPPVGRHISERISGFRAPQSPPSSGHHRARYAPRQSDSGWSGRKARYS
ncbi:hypothetical protein MJO29_007973 [Puccinia striiformis f. sp. tritici]|nr:hypothetical protein MJO29_007973 [Puccinia striiformis f. sp. tritici]